MKITQLIYLGAHSKVLIEGIEMRNINYGIIGTGAMGREHIRNIELIDNAQVVAICDSHRIQ